MKVIVGVSDMKVSNNPNETLITYSLGSCIGLVVYDPRVKVAGILHYMLPESSLDNEKARKNPYMFANTGIPSLFKAAYALGAKKQHMSVTVVGGAQILDQKGFFNIGKRNHMALRKLLFKNNVIIGKEDVGGNSNRTIRIEVGTGDTFLKTSGKEDQKL